MLEFLQDIFVGIDPTVGYAIFCLSAFIENVFPPIPGDTVVVLGAYLVSTGQLGFWGVYISTTIGSVAGFVTMYFIGLKFGRSFIRDTKFGRKLFKEEQISRVEVWFSRWGYWVIFANRFLSGTRSVISLFAGFFHLHPLRVILLATISALIWNALLISIGVLLGDNWQNITSIISRYNQIFMVLFVAFIIYFFYRRRKKRTPK